MGKDIQMGEDLMITDEVREKFCLNEDPESEEPLRRPVRWRRDPGGIAFYDMRIALKDYVTDPYSMHMAKDILENHPKSVYISANEKKDRDGTRTFLAKLTGYDSLFNYSFSAGNASLTGNRLFLDARDGYLDKEGRLESYRNGYYDDETQDGFDDDPNGRCPAEHYLNINGLILCKMLWDKTDKLAEETADLTDEKAREFFRSLEESNRADTLKTDLAEPQRIKAVELYPRIIMEGGAAKLSFRIQRAGGKTIVVRNVRELVAAYVDRAVLTLSKTESIDFREYDFTDRSAGLYDFLQRKVGDVSDINSQIAAKNMRSWHSVRTINVTSNLDFKGAVLDNFYDAWEGQKAEYQDKTNGVTSKEIPVGHRDIRLSLTCDRLSDAKGVFSGIAVHGLIPVLLSGSGSHRYTLNADGLSRITKKEQETVKPFDKAADSSGYFRFQVGLSNLQEFYYRVVPAFLENPSVDFTDNCEQEAEGYLPPEPHFDFYLDCETPDFSGSTGSHAEKGRKRSREAIHFLRCTGKVRYREKSRKGSEDTEKICTLGISDQKDGYRDIEQERRVVDAVRSLLLVISDDEGAFSGVFNDEQLFDFLQSGVAVLEKYGTVHGSEAFRKFTVAPVPKVKVGISVESGILDLSLTSSGISERELLEVLQSYRRNPAAIPGDGL